jgi:hypothetical protein
MLVEAAGVYYVLPGKVGPGQCVWSCRSLLRLRFRAVSRDLQGWERGGCVVDPLGKVVRGASRGSIN